VEAVEPFCQQGKDAICHHLRRLVDAGLLSTRSEGTFHYYAADYPALQALTTYLWEDCCRGSKAGSKSGCC